MTEQDFSGDYINELNTEDNAILTIASDVTSEEKDHPTKKVVVNGKIVAKKYTSHSVEVDNGQGLKTYSIGPQTGIRFQMSWGKDSSKWIGKQFTIKHEPYMSFGKEKIGLGGYPIVEQKV